MSRRSWWPKEVLTKLFLFPAAESHTRLVGGKAVPIKVTYHEQGAL